MEQRCEKCGKTIKEGREVSLELNMMDGRYYPLGTVKVEESQGCFIFGSDCAKMVLNNGGVV